MKPESYSFWQDRPVFITGATGLIGGWLLRRLVGLDADIICLVRDWVPQSELVRGGFIDRVKIVRGDVCDQRLIERTLNGYKVDTVIHLAAQSIVPIANRDPVSTFETNIGGTWAILEACRTAPSVKQVVLASSDKAYGVHETLPYTEETPLQGRNPYDVSKACADMLAQAYASTYKLPVAVTRCGNFFGGGDLNWNRIVPGTIRSVLRNQPPVLRSDGKFIRDYFYIEDAVEAYVTLVEALAKNPHLRGEAFNFSYEVQVTVLELVDMILKLLGSDLKPVIQNKAAHEIRFQYLSAEKARRLLKWEPVFTMEQGLDRTIQWYQNFLLDRAD